MADQPQVARDSLLAVLTPEEIAREEARAVIHARTIKARMNSLVWKWVIICTMGWCALWFCGQILQTVMQSATTSQIEALTPKP
jgi:hypothetical protein